MPLSEWHPPFSSSSSFSSNGPNLAGDKNTVYQKHGLCHPEYAPSPTLSLLHVLAIDKSSDSNDQISDCESCGQDLHRKDPRLTSHVEKHIGADALRYIQYIDIDIEEEVAKSLNLRDPPVLRFLIMNLQRDIHYGEKNRYNDSKTLRRLRRNACFLSLDRLEYTPSWPPKRFKLRKCLNM